MVMRKKVAVVISQTTKAEILASLTEIRGKLAFLTTLKASDIQSMLRVGRDRIHPRDRMTAIGGSAQAGLPQSGDQSPEDNRLSRDLAVLVAEINRLAEKLQEDLSEVNAETMIAALGTYAALKREADKLPGLNLVSPELADFFKSAKRESTPAKT
jgi:hypothetical protein